MDIMKSEIAQKAIGIMEARGHEFQKDENGEASLSPQNIIYIVIGMLVLAFTAPIAIEELSTVNTTGWDSTVVSLWEMTPIFAVLGFLMMIIAPMLYKRMK